MVVSKHFEEDYAERYTAAAFLLREFQTAAGASVRESETRHLKLRAWASNPRVWAGATIALVLEVELKPGLHVYAPGVQPSYIPVQWSITNTKAWLASPARFPPSRRLHLEAIQEIVPVFENRFRLTRELKIGHVPQLREALGQSRDVRVEGSFRYQACDDKLCYPPQTVPLEWSLPLVDLDRQRAPAELRGGRGPG